MTPNSDLARKPPNISGAQADNTFAKSSKNLLASNTQPNKLYEWPGQNF
jgi:hypothetical protein